MKKTYDYARKCWHCTRFQEEQEPLMVNGKHMGSRSARFYVSGRFRNAYHVMPEKHQAGLESYCRALISACKTIEELNQVHTYRTSLSLHKYGDRWEYEHTHGFAVLPGSNMLSRPYSKKDIIQEDEGKLIYLKDFDSCKAKSRKFIRINWSTMV